MTLPTLLELREERGTSAQKARDIIDLANAEKREMTNEENKTIRQLIATGEQLSVRIEQEERLGSIEDRAMTPSREAQRMVPDGQDDAELRAAQQHWGSGKKFRSLGEQLMAVKDHTLGIRHDPRLFEVRAGIGLNESVGSDGAFLVQPEYSQKLFERSYETGQVFNRCDRLTIGANFNSAKLPGINETSRVDGSRWGGLLAYWTAEGATKTASRPSFRLMDLVLKKLTVLVYATDEMLQDSQLLDGYINRVVPEEISFQLDTAVLRGLGGGVPLGILNSTAFLAVAAAAGSGARLLSDDVLAIYSRTWAPSRARAVWFINQDVEPQLFKMTLGTATVNQAVYIPPGGLSGAPYATLMGRPVVPIEQASTMGTVGDIILADMGEYAVIDKGGLQTATSIHVAFVTDEQVFRFVYRVDGQPKWQAPLTPYQGSNTLSAFVGVATRT